jgi:hypothetical protein
VEAYNNFRNDTNPPPQCIPIGGQELALHVPGSWGVEEELALPGQHVYIRPGSIHPEEVRSMRGNQLTALIIQRAGTVVQGGCHACRNNVMGMGPFLDCRQIVGKYVDCCANCYWKENMPNICDLKRWPEDSG